MVDTAHPINRGARPKSFRKQNSRRITDGLWKLAERDGWVCWLCAGRVEPDATDKMLRPSADHVVPRSLGGKRSVENLRLAHRRCNSKRGSELVVV